MVKPRHDEFTEDAVVKPRHDEICSLSYLYEFPLQEIMSKLRHFKKATSSPHLLTPDELQTSVNKSSEHLRVLWISYSLFAIYLIITSLSVTHRHLFLELPIRLPVLNIDLGLQDFFIAAPILFIGMHLYLVFHVNLLYQQVVKYQDIIHTNPTQQERKSYLFDPFVFLQSWVGHAKGWRSKIGFALITHGSLKVFPICVLLLIMLSALPYHDEKLTHYHRFMVMLDFVVIAVFAVNWNLIYHILCKKKLWLFTFRNLLKRTLWHLTYRILMTFTLYIILFITLFGILVFKGEKLYKVQSVFKPITKFLLEGDANYITGKPESLFSNRLILVNEDFVDEKVVEELDTKEKKSKKDTKMMMRKRGRHFENAVFDYSNLPRTDFTGAYISGASFIGSNLEKSNFSCDKLPDENTSDKIRSSKDKSPKDKCLSIQNENTNFSEANLKNTNFNDVQLEDAELSQAELQGANLSNAKLKDANLSYAGLQGAELSQAELQGADLSNTDLQGTNLDCVDLEYTDLNSANIWNSFFSCNDWENTKKSYTAFLQNFIFEDNTQEWSEDILQTKEYWLKTCSQDDNKKTCTNDIEEWFQKTAHPTTEQIEERKKMWQDAQENSIYYKNKSKDEFIQDFWQYRVKELVCTNEVTTDAMISQIQDIQLRDRDIDNYKNSRQIFAQTLLKHIDDEEQEENCKLDPPLTDEQRATLEGWLKTSD